MKLKQIALLIIKMSKAALNLHIYVKKNNNWIRMMKEALFEGENLKISTLFKYYRMNTF